MKTHLQKMGYSTSADPTHKLYIYDPRLLKYVPFDDNIQNQLNQGTFAI